jgi:neopullulanase
MTEVNSSKEKLEAAFSLLLTLRGIPQIYYGDEIGMIGGDDPNNRHDFPGGFPGDPHNAFTASGRTPEEQAILMHVQTLLRLRQAHSALRRGRQYHMAWNDSYYAFVRETRDEKLLVIFNNAGPPRNVHFAVDGTPLQDVRGLERLFGPGDAQIKAKTVEATLPATT